MLFQIIHPVLLGLLLPTIVATTTSLGVHSTTSSPILSSTHSIIVTSSRKTTSLSSRISNSFLKTSSVLTSSTKKPTSSSSPTSIKKSSTMVGSSQTSSSHTKKTSSTSKPITSSSPSKQILVSSSSSKLATSSNSSKSVKTSTSKFVTIGSSLITASPSITVNPSTSKTITTSSFSTPLKPTTSKLATPSTKSVISSSTSVWANSTSSSITVGSNTSKPAATGSFSISVSPSSSNSVTSSSKSVTSSIPSEGVKSSTIAVLPTISILPSATTSSPLSSFTGTTVEANQNPSTCYGLPVPLSSVDLYSSSLTTDTQLDSPISVYLTPSASDPDAIYWRISVDGAEYVYDVSNPDQLAIYAIYSESTSISLVVNPDGLFFAGVGCYGALSVAIANFTEQIHDFAGPRALSKRRRALSKRGETDFIVNAFVEDQCGNPISNIQPTLTYGQSPCQFDQVASGEMTWTCQYPGSNNPESLCQENTISALNFVSQGFGGGPITWGTAAGIIATLFPESLAAELFANYSLPWLTNGALLINALAALAVAEKVFPEVGQDQIAVAICEQSWVVGEALGLYLGPQSVVLGSISGPPTTTFNAGTATISDPASTSC